MPPRHTVSDASAPELSIDAKIILAGGANCQRRETRLVLNPIHGQLCYSNRSMIYFETSALSAWPRAGPMLV